MNYILKYNCLIIFPHIFTDWSFNVAAVSITLRSQLCCTFHSIYTECST